MKRDAMSAIPDLQFRRLEESEYELAAALAGAAQPSDDPGSINFGAGALATRSGDSELWGVFIRGGLGGVACFAPSSGWAEVRALHLARDWRRTGLAEWMLTELARTASLSGGVGVVVRIASGTPAVGEMLADAGFSGPDAEDEGYPNGEWRLGSGLARQSSVNFG